MAQESKIPRSEQETIISWDKEKRTWHFYSDDPVHIRKWGAAIQPERKTFYMDGSPKVLEGNINGSVSVRKHVEISNERRAEMSERAKRNRQRQILGE